MILALAYFPSAGAFLCFWKCCFQAPRKGVEKEEKFAFISDRGLYIVDNVYFCYVFLWGGPVLLFLV